MCLSPCHYLSHVLTIRASLFLQFSLPPFIFYPLHQHWVQRFKQAPLIIQRVKVRLGTLMCSAGAGGDFISLIAFEVFKTSAGNSPAWSKEERHKEIRMKCYGYSPAAALWIKTYEAWKTLDTTHFIVGHFTPLSWTKNITNLQLSAEGKFANVVNDSRTIEVNSLINLLRIILHHNWRKKKKKKRRIWKSNRMSSALFQSLRSSWILTITSWHRSWHLP